MPQNWKRLRLGRHETCPPLFFSYDFSSKGYDLHLTDLVHVWSESLSHKQILTRASKVDISVDPSEDDDQFSVLLQKVGDALGGAKGTAVSLTSSGDQSGLELMTTTELPSPLDPLEWKIYLSMQPQNALTKQILLPILKGEADRAARLQSLIDLLKEKDWALSKVFEKIESTGVDLSRAFPGLSGMRADRKGGSALSQVSKLIKGTAPFDEKAWDSSFGDQKTARNLGVDIATELNNVSSYRDWDAVEANLDDWWVRLETLGSTVDKTKSGRKKSPEARKRTIQEQPRTSESDDDFERQRTPPHLRQARRTESAEKDNETRPKPSSKAAHEKATTESESERESASPSPPPQKPAARKGLGTIGAGQKKQPVSKQDEPTESESDIPAKTKTKNKKPNDLGTIGGAKGKPATRVQKPSLESTESESAESGEGPERTQPPAPADIETASESDDDVKLRVQRKKREEKGNRDLKNDEGEEQAEVKPKKPRAGGGLGQIGGKKHREQKPTERQSPSLEGGDEEEEAKEKDANIARTNKRTDKEHEASPVKPKRPGKLGTIGGGRGDGAKQARQQKEPQADEARKPKPRRDAEETESGSEGDPAEKAKANPKKETPSEEPASKPESPTGAPVRRSAWPKEDVRKKEQKAETAEERADRKRQELRQQLETRGPAKKKRKF